MRLLPRLRAPKFQPDSAVDSQIVFWLAVGLSFALHRWFPAAVYFSSLLSTIAHEVGHCAAASTIDVKCTSLIVMPNRSGVVTTLPNTDLELIIISASGILAPPVIGAMTLIMARGFRASTIALMMLSLSLFATAVIIADSQFTRVICFAFAAVFGLAAMIANDVIRSLLTLIVAVEFAVNGVLSSLNYGFVDRAHLGDGRVLISDTGKIADLTGSNHTIWAVFLAGASILILYLSYSMTTRQRGRR